MDVDAHIKGMCDELDAAVVKEIASRYRTGIAALTMIEVPEVRQLWASREFYGIDSVKMAIEKVVFDDTKNDYVDGIATGKEYGRNDPLDWGLYWNSKLSDQIFQNAHEFGPSPCKSPMISEVDRQELLGQIRTDVAAQFVFGAMKHIALARANRQHTLHLAEHWYFRSVSQSPGFVEQCADILHRMGSSLGYTIKVVPVRQSLFKKRPALSGNLDVVIQWEKR